MKTLWFVSKSREVVGAVLRCCGSTSAPCDALLAVMAANSPTRDICEEADRLVVAAVPEEGSDGLMAPLRATADIVDYNVVIFTTPHRGVLIRIEWRNNQYEVLVDFKRDSKWLAAQILMGILVASREPGLRVKADERDRRLAQVLGQHLLVMDENTMVAPA